MGGMVGALYATGRPVSELKDVMNNQVFSSVFRIKTAYKNQNWRRREDTRELPNALTVGLKHGVSIRNSVLSDQGLNLFLDREFLRYDDRVDFNTLPIPFRAIATDLNEARTVTFARGSIADAVRASVSIPGVYSPFELNGHEFVDGGVLENLPTQTIRAMKADVVLAVSLPEPPVAKGELDSILGVVQRSFSVAIEGNEEISRRLADVVIEPDLSGFTINDYLRTKDLAARGYEAAEKQKAALLKYAVSDAQWEAYLAERAGKVRGAPGTVLAVKVKAPSESATTAVEAMFAPLVNQPVSADRVEKLLADVRGDGRYEADYTVGYQGDGANRRPVLLVTVADKKTGPPFLLVGANVQAQTGGGLTRATVEGILLDQDFGGFGSELRSHFKVGSITELQSEYFRKLPGSVGASEANPMAGMFVAPDFDFLREEFPIYTGKVQVAQRLLQRTGGGLDVGWGDMRTMEVRVGWEANDIRWRERIGIDGLPDVAGSMQRGRVRFAVDTQDNGLVPQFGYRVSVDARYMYHAVQSVNTPQFTTDFGLAHKVGNEIFFFGGEAGTMLGRDVAQPFRFTLGGPMRLAASGIDEYRGTDYFLLQPAMLRKVASLPAVLGQSIYVGGMYEAGQMRAPDMRTVTRQDVFLGVVGETPLGVITIGPALGDGGQYKLVFTLGKVF